MSSSVIRKIALVTGAGRGIGAAIAVGLARDGWTVAVNDLSEESSADTVAAVTGHGGTAAPAPADITSEAAVAECVREVERRLGPISLIVNNAAIIHQRRFIESTPADWQRTFDVCLTGTLLCTHAVLPGMVSRRTGGIINIASDSARVGQAHDSYYAAAKAGVIAFTKSLALEVGPSGVRANVVSPSATDTPMFQAAQTSRRQSLGPERYERYWDRLISLYPLRKIGTPEDVANAVAFLASDRAGHITGQTLSVNGGFIMP